MMFLLIGTKKGGFENRGDLGLTQGEQYSLFTIEIDEYKSVFARMKKYELAYLTIFLR